MNTTQEADKGLNTDRPHRKYEQVPSMINNQFSQDICSPISKVKERNHNFDCFPRMKAKENSNPNDVFKTYVSTELPLSAAKSYETKSALKSHNNQVSSQAVSGMNSPESHTFLPKRITEDSMDYTEKSRTEELEELEGIKHEARKKYIDQKRIYEQFRRNPFSIGANKADIGPFKEFINRKKDELRSSTERGNFREVYNGAKLSDSQSLDDSLDAFRDGTAFCGDKAILQKKNTTGMGKPSRSKLALMSKTKR